MKRSLLIVEDDAGIRPALVRTFTRKGFEVHEVTGAAEAQELLRTRQVHVVLLDLCLPDGSGLEVLEAAHAIDQDIDVIIMTAFPELKTAVRAMQAGARDYIIKPFELDELHLSVARVLEYRQLHQTVRRLTRSPSTATSPGAIIGASAAVAALRDEIGKVAPAATAVLVVGETGTGKELVADAIHALSPRAAAPLVKANCSAFAERLLESELFGHERGAFTDAKEARAGLFEMADGGTLFLDEISELKLDVQAKLLRIVEGQPFQRLGGHRSITADVRVIAASNRDLAARVRQGAFREDLYFRLNVFRIEMPPLRARGQDVLLLAEHFLERYGATLRKGPLALDEAARATLLAYPWPGNVRELRNVMERAAILAEGGRVALAQLPRELQAGSFIAQAAGGDAGALPSLQELERRYIDHVLSAVDGNLSEAARLLGISRNTLKARVRP